MNELTIIIKTLDRYICLKPLLKSIIKKYKDIPILIGDDSIVSCKERIKKDFPNANITVYELPIDCGLSYGRNYLVKKVNTKYFCLCDDDFIFDKRTDLITPLKILKEKKVDIIGGYIRNYKIISSFKDYIIRLGQKILHYELPTNYIGKMKEVNSVLYVDYKIKEFPSYEEVDLVPNFFIAKTDVIKENLWDVDLKLQEHTAFFYKLKKSNIKVAFTNKLSVRHCPIQNKKYKNFRTRNYTHVFMEKNKISKIVATYDNKQGSFENVCPKLDNVLVSIIVPVYNAFHKVDFLIKTLKDQTYKNLEFILVDNNSTDNTLNYLKDVTKGDKRFTVLSEKKQGPNYARKKGFEHSKGKYIYFCDADDYLEDDTIYHFMCEIKKNYSDVVIGDYIEHNENSVKRMRGIYQKYNDNLKSYKDILLIKPALWNKIFKRELINNNSFIFTYISEDLLISLLSMARSNKISYINKVVYHYIASSIGLSSTTSYEKLINLIDSQKLVEEAFKKEKLYTEYINELNYIFISHSIYRMFKITTLKNKKEKNDAYLLFSNHIKEYDKNNIYLKRSKLYYFAYKIVTHKALFKFLSPFIKLLFTNKKINKMFRKLDR